MFRERSNFLNLKIVNKHLQLYDALIVAIADSGGNDLRIQSLLLIRRYAREWSCHGIPFLEIKNWLLCYLQIENQHQRGSKCIRRSLVDTHCSNEHSCGHCFLSLWSMLLSILTVGTLEVFCEEDVKNERWYRADWVELHREKLSVLAWKETYCAMCIKKQIRLMMK